jgi:hypothetical protein
LTIIILWIIWKLFLWLQKYLSIKKNKLEEDYFRDSHI